MTSARDVIAGCISKAAECEVALGEGVVECSQRRPCTVCFNEADAMIAALDAAGFAIVPKALLKPKVNAKAFARLDEMAEADIAMDGDHALSILLKHYRELTAAKETT